MSEGRVHLHIHVHESTQYVPHFYCTLARQGRGQRGVFVIERMNIDAVGVVLVMGIWSDGWGSLGLEW